MTCPVSTRFKLVDHYGDPTLMEELEVNIKHWMDWAFLGIGAWTEVNSGSSGIYGGNFYELFPVNDGSYEDNQVYRSLRKDWVHETGVNYNSPNQNIDYAVYNEEYDDVEIFLEDGEIVNFSAGDNITIVNNELFSGAQTVGTITGDNSFTITTSATFMDTIDDSLVLQSGETLLFQYFEPTGTGISSLGYVYGTYDPEPLKVYYDGVLLNSGYTVDYPNGKIIFDSGLGSSPLSVTADYSYRNVQTYIASQAPRLFEVEKDSFDPSAIDQSVIPTGTVITKDFTADPSQKIQLPAVIIEAIAKRESSGFQIGGQTLRCNQDMLMTVISQNKYECKLITDILANQKHKTLKLYDIDVVNKKNKMPLTYEGDINLSGLNYNDLANASEYFWADCWIKEAYVSEVTTNSPDLFINKVRYQTEVIRG